MIQNQITVEEMARALKPILGRRADEIYFRYLNSESYEEKSEIYRF